MSILLCDYKQLTECISEVELRDARVNSKNNGLMRKENKKSEKNKKYLLTWTVLLRKVLNVKYVRRDAISLSLNEEYAFYPLCPTW